MRKGWRAGEHIFCSSGPQMAHLVRSSLHDEDVLWFEVSVDDTLAVQETNPSIWGR